ncbi:MAG: SMP-30/gluconolactonase/LRE family protein [Deltaproteobacteria bacterium]|nr:SMP-30/gluconolactonase/LRE family protein [Deltaproteobacteria bacterium]
MVVNAALKKIGIISGLGLFVFLSGCAAISQKDELIPMFWPDPPEKTRIKYVQSFRSRDDVGGPSVLEVVVGRTPQAALRQPMGVTISEDGKRIYVADFAWSAVFVFDFKARETRIIGDQERHPLGEPVGVALDVSENVYVTDSRTRSVRVYDKNGNFLKSIGKDLLVRPTGVAVDKKRQRLYVVDTGHNDERAHQVKVFDLEGKLIREIGRRGKGDGEFNFPTFATVDTEGRLYVVDSANFRVQVFDQDGKFLRKFGRSGDKVGDFARPKAVALDSFGNVYVVDSMWSNIQIFNQKGELLLNFGGVGTYPGLLLNPAAITIDKENTIYISDTFGRRISIYQLVNTTAEESWETQEANTKGGENNTEDKKLVASKVAEVKTKGGENK